MIIKGCIFDLDGTLVDTRESLKQAVNMVMEKLSLPPITLEQTRQFVGNGAKMLIERAILAGGGSANRTGEALQIYKEIFPGLCTYKVVTYEGITELLYFLKEKGIKMGVCSNKPDLETQIVCKEVFGEDLFEYIKGQVDEMPHKPDPAIVNHALTYMSMTSEQCLYIGDSEVDMQTANVAGLYAVGVSWGFRDVALLKQEGADIIIDKPVELKGFFK